VNDIIVEGFTGRQRILADLMWAMDSEAQVQQFISTLPKNVARDARVVREMILLAAMDQIEAVDQAQLLIKQIVDKP
jgi:hypothetical protein